MKEIEPSSRLFERGDAIYMTLSTLRGIERRPARRTTRSVSCSPATAW